MSIQEYALPVSFISRKAYKTARNCKRIEQVNTTIVNIPVPFLSGRLFFYERDFYLSNTISKGIYDMSAKIPGNVNFFYYAPPEGDVLPIEDYVEAAGRRRGGVLQIRRGS
jgi:hypothetical protein